MASTGTKFHVNDNTVRVCKELPNGVCVDSGMMKHYATYVMLRQKGLQVKPRKSDSSFKWQKSRPLDHILLAVHCQTSDCSLCCQQRCKSEFHWH